MYSLETFTSFMYWICVITPLEMKGKFSAKN